MITPLRKRHRWLAPGAFAAGLIGLCVALGARPGAFVEAASDAAIPAFVPPAGALGVEDTEGRFLVAWTPPTAEGGGTVWLVPHGPLDAPDLLLYLVEGPDEDTSGVPAGAVFLGTAHPERATALLVPGWSSTSAASSIVLFSLAHQERFATALLRAATNSEGPR